MKKILSVLLMIVMLAAFAAGSAGAENAEYGCLEGSGYSTPEEAVLAYIDAMNHGDIGGMLSMFAHETLTEHADPILYLQYVHSFKTSSMQNTIPADDPYARSLVTQARYGILAADLLATFAYAAAGESNPPTETAEQRRELQEKMKQSPYYSLQGNVEFVRWLNPVNLTKGKATDPRRGTDAVSQVLWTGADDITELVAELRVNGAFAILGMRCACYGGRWYNLDYNNNAVMLAGGMEAADRYLWLPDGETQQKIEQLLQEDYPEENAAWDALQRSSQAGERWPLVSLSKPGTTVYDTREAAAGDSGAGIWAEVNFHRTGGGVVTLAAGASLREELGMAGDTARVCFPWSPLGVQTTVVNNKGKEIPTIKAYDKQEITFDWGIPDVSLDETTLTVTLRDGTQAVFRKPETANTPSEDIRANDMPAGRLEGDGFGTPEDAVMAYVEAMNRADVRGMLSTFALESYVENADPMVWLAQLRTFNARKMNTIPYGDREMIRSMAVYARYGELARDLLQCYALFTTRTPDPIMLKTLEEIRDFRKQFRRNPLNGLKGNVEFIKWINPAEMTGGIILEPGEERGSAGSAASYCSEDYTYVIARLRINGMDAYQAMTCVRYNGRWYNLAAGGRLNYLFRADASLLMPEVDHLSLELNNLEPVEAEKANAIWDAMQKNPLAGSVWPLVQVVISDAEVCETAADAENDPNAGVWGQIRFLSTGGGIMTLTASPALQEDYGMDDATARIIFSWQPEEAGSDHILFREFYPLYMDDMKFNSAEEMSLSEDGTVIKVTLADETRLIFRKP